MIHQSGKSKQDSLLKKWCRIVENNGMIGWVELIQALGITLDTYNKYKTYILSVHPELIQYNKNNKKWIWIAKIELEKEEAAKLV